MHYPVDAKNNLPSVIVEIQKNLSHEFLARITRYGLNVFDETKTFHSVMLLHHK
ncbi:uncharacterized protein EV154DRAFT_532278 [Mucor mucedo]|uniref:uncharacterized protein n=1 Tax=Mucor mucedo TaxID=29922 RepID=UPI0022204517|nr:uncharacterized protein EV154DRAFT_532278 [Mucor mucedo]KAI7867063.1 hypothetical protein EV154DRAFT_532278 [Mucor mucedo]